MFLSINKEYKILYVPLNQEGKIVYADISGYVDINLLLLREGYDNDLHLDFIQETMKPDSNNYYIRNEDFSETNVAPIIYIYASGQQFEGNITYVFNRDTSTTNFGGKLSSIEIVKDTWEGVASVSLNNLTLTISFGNIIAITDNHWLEVNFVYDDGYKVFSSLFFTN